MTRHRQAREFLVEAGVFVPGWLADWLERNTDISSVRVRVRGDNVAVDEALMALRYAAMTHRAGSAASSVSGTELGVSAEPAPR
jgi:hypothetical protein